MNEYLLSVSDSWLITFLASFLIWFLFAGLIILWVVDGKLKKEVAIHAFFSAILAWVIAEVVKSLVPSLRPFEINGYVPLTLTIPGDNSFPSSHAALAFSLATSVWLHNKKYGLFFVLGAIGVCLGRILAYVHYPVDLAGGALIGILTAYLFQRLHLGKLISGRSGSSNY